MPGTTPVYGFPYPEPTDLVADYPALGQDLAEDIEAVLPTLGGFSAIVPSTIANSGGTATLSGSTVTYNAVNSVSLNSVFTADYTQYRVLVSCTASAAGAFLYMRNRVAGVDAATNYDQQRLYVNGSSVAGAQNAASTGGGIGAVLTTKNVYGVDVFGPQLAEKPGFVSVGGYEGGIEIFTTIHTTATAYDGFSLLPSSGTITGIVNVYGYKE